MATISAEEDYKSTEYFHFRHGDESVEHCVGNSCDNLLGLNQEVVPAPHLEIPEVHQPAVTVDKPARSDPDEAEVGAQTVLPPHVQPPVYVHSVDADTFAQTEYYSELRRRSLEGRAPIHFDNSGEQPLQENLASEEFDVALY